MCKTQVLLACDVIIIIIIRGGRKGGEAGSLHIYIWGAQKEKGSGEINVLIASAASSNDNA